MLRNSPAQKGRTGMKLLQMCVAVAIAAGVAVCPHAANAQALSGAATLNAGVSSAGSASASALGNSMGRTMRRERRRIGASSKTSTSGGVVNLQWSRQELKRSARTTRTQAKHNGRARSEKAQPDFVIVGADPPNADSADVPVSQPRSTNRPVS